MQLRIAEHRPKGYIPTDIDKAAFIASAAHLLRQNARAEGEKTFSIGNNCVYLAHDGKRCAVGCLMDPLKYSRTLEGYGVGSERVIDALRDEYHKAQPRLLGSLQAVHDLYLPADWPECLWSLAVYWGFEPTKVLPEDVPQTASTVYELI